MIKVNNIAITPTIFPDKTSQVWNLDKELLNAKFFDIVWEFESEAEFMHLAQLKSLADLHNILCFLSIPYLPYARQDKEVSNNTTFALTSFSVLLNSLNFTKVFFSDVHSSRSTSLITNSKSLNDFSLLESLVNTGVVIAYPDEGAYIRYLGITNNIQPYILCTKVRDSFTGEILCYSVPEYSTTSLYKDATPLEYKDIVIVDDICDGGATFIALAKELRKLNVGKITLYVTHGLFTKGLQVLYDSGINEIYTYKGLVK